MTQTLNLSIIKNVIILIAILLLFSLLVTTNYTSEINNPMEIPIDPNWPYDTPHISNPINVEQ